MQHVQNHFLLFSVSVTLEKKFTVASCDFRKMVEFFGPPCRFTNTIYIYMEKSLEPAQSPFPCIFSALLSAAVNCRRGFILEKFLRDKSHTLTKFLIFKEISHSVTVECLGIVLIKFKCIPGCFHLCIIQQQIWNVSPLSHLTRCFGVLVPFISVCLLPFPATSALTLGWSRRWWSGLVPWQANTQWVEQHREAQESSEVHKCVDFGQGG